MPRAFALALLLLAAGHVMADVPLFVDAPAPTGDLGWLLGDLPEPPPVIDLPTSPAFAVPAKPFAPTFTAPPTPFRWDGQQSLRPADALMPPAPRAWEAKESLRVGGPLFAFTDLGTQSGDADRQRWQATHRLGLGATLTPWPGPELLVRGGSVVRADESRLPAPGDRPELFVELQAKLAVPVVGPLTANYAGTDLPALSAAALDRIDHDFKLAWPVGGAGQMHVGARVRGDDGRQPSPLFDRAQLTFGFTLLR